MAARTKTRKRKRAAKKSPTIRILVLRAPGTNCDQETGYAFEREGATVEHMHVNALLAQPKVLTRVHGLAIPGGFSYGDDLGAGTVLGTAMRTRLLEPIQRMVDKGGIAPERLVAKGYGPTVPLQPGTSQEAYAANRRVEFHIIGGAPEGSRPLKR